MSLLPAQTDRAFHVLRATLVSTILLGPFAFPMPAAPDTPPIEDGITAWMKTREYVDQMHAPAQEQSQDAGSDPSFEGVSVVIRFQGRIIGLGDARDAGSHTLRLAVEEAIRDARDSKKVRDLPYDMIEAVGQGSSIELELAGTPVPLLGETLEETASRVRPGKDGIAIRRGDRWRYAYPGRMQAYGQSERPDRVIIRLLRELGLPPRDPSELRLLDDVEIYRFDVLALGQEQPRSAPFESFRGAEIIPENMDIRELAATIAGEASANIQSRLAVDPEVQVGEIAGSDRLTAIGLFGDYDLARDKFEPLIAGSADQALSAWALASYAGSGADLTRESRQRFITLVRLVLERLSMVDTVEDEPLLDPMSPALVVLAGLEARNTCESIGIPWDPPQIMAEARTALLGQLAADERDENAQEGVTIALQLLAAMQLTRVEPEIIEEQALEALRDHAWRQQSAEQLIGSLHLFLLAEPDELDEKTAMMKWHAVRHALEAAIASQVSNPDADAGMSDPVGDLGGGFVLSGTPRVTATASSLRPALALAIALQDQRATGIDEASRERWKRALALALRFARQLQVHGGMLARAVSPERAVGGIKRAPWSNRLALADTALALLLASEILSDTGEEAP